MCNFAVSREWQPRVDSPLISRVRETKLTDWFLVIVEVFSFCIDCSQTKDQ